MEKLSHLNLLWETNLFQQILGQIILLENILNFRNIGDKSLSNKVRH